MRVCVCVCVCGCVCASEWWCGGRSVYHEVRPEEVMLSEGVFAWKCEQWMDPPPTHTHTYTHTPTHTHIHSARTHTHTHTHTHASLHSPTLGEMKASSSQVQCQGQSMAN